MIYAQREFIATTPANVQYHNVVWEAGGLLVRE